MAKKKNEWTPVLPVPDDVATPEPVHPKLGKPKFVWPYYSADGALLGLACDLIDTDSIVKQPYLYLYCRDGEGKTEWRWEKTFPTPAPLFNLDILKAQPNADVFVVQTEREADAIIHMFPDVVAVTWSGLEASVNYTDWRPLKDRKVCVWPANSASATVTMNNVVIAVRPIATSVSIMSPPANAPDGWSAIMAFQTKADPTALKSGVRELLPVDYKPPVAPVPPPDPEMFPFRCLGFDHGDYFYHPRGMNQILRLTAVGHSKANLLSLAPLTWWESAYPGAKGASWDAAADSLIRAQEKIGPYDHNKCRGRGVWMDNGRTIFHLGDRIHDGEKEVEIKNFETKFIYECRTGLNSLSKDMLTVQEGDEFLKICEMPTWERPIHARYLAGWSVIATICGGLDWRPSIWITGPSGSGKTWIIERVLQPILGDVRLYAMGKSTEAGLRQALHSDALPIVIEEAEQDNKIQDQHIQGILTLMRQSSSETGAKIYRGTTSGQALEYCIRSTFCFGSIGVGAKHHADQSRVTVLTLLQGDTKKFGLRFEKMKEMVSATITNEYGAKFRARALKMLPIIRQNANVFADCVARLLKSKRIGDQIGVLLAGAYSLRCDTLVDREAASEFVQEQDWSDEQAQNDTRDESACLESILQIMIPVTDGSVRREKQVVELINEMVGKGKSEVAPSVADDYLRRWGIRVDQDNGNIYISNSSVMILKALKDTAWASNYPRMLRRIKGAEAIARMRFTGFSTRCVQIPLTAVLSGQEENEQLNLSNEGGFDAGTSEQSEQ